MADEETEEEERFEGYEGAKRRRIEKNGGEREKERRGE